MQSALRRVAHRKVFLSRKKYTAEEQYQAYCHQAPGRFFAVRQASPCRFRPDAYTWSRGRRGNFCAYPTVGSAGVGTGNAQNAPYLCLANFLLALAVIVIAGWLIRVVSLSRPSSCAEAGLIGQPTEFSSGVAEGLHVDEVDDSSSSSSVGSPLLSFGPPAVPPEK